MFNINEKTLEVLTAILLGVTALLSAWSGWIGSLHGGNQATNYTKSNNMSATGNSMYNEAAQYYMQDVMTWNNINGYLFDKEVALANGNKKEAELIDEKIDTLMYHNCSEEFLEAIEWAFDQEEDVTPFDKEGFVDSYFADANEVLEEAESILEEGQQDNSNGDAFGLVSVILSLVLFLLGIIGIFKQLPNRRIILCVSIVFLLVATIYMFTIPMPTGFSFASFFNH